MVSNPRKLDCLSFGDQSRSSSHLANLAQMASTYVDFQAQTFREKEIIANTFNSNLNFGTNLTQMTTPLFFKMEEKKYLNKESIANLLTTRFLIVFVTSWKLNLNPLLL